MSNQLKLFYSPGACSLAPHILLEEVRTEYEPVQVLLAAGEHMRPEYLRINPKGRVPALVDGDFVVTENPAILRYVAQRFGSGCGFWPGDAESEARCAEWLAWISSTVHMVFALVGRPERYSADEACYPAVRAKGHHESIILCREIDRRIGSGPWALGEHFSVVDPYLIVWWITGRDRGIDMWAECPSWSAQAVRMAARPAVQRAFAREGLVLPEAPARGDRSG